MLEENVALKREIADLNARITHLIEERRRLPGAYSTLGSKIIGLAMAALGVGLAAVWGTGGLLAAIAAGMIGAVTGHWVGRRGGEWWEDRSKVKITKEIGSKKEALLEAKMRHLEQEALEPGTDFILNDRFPGEDDVLYGKPNSTLFVTKIWKLATKRREKGTVKIKLKILNLSDMDLYEDDLKGLLRRVVEIFDIETLILKNNQMKDSDIQYLREMMCQEREAFPRLKRLDLSGNDLTGSSLAAIEEMASALDLIELNLSDNKHLGSLFKKDRFNEKVLVPSSIEPLRKFLRSIPETIPSLKYLGLRNVGLRMLAPDDSKDTGLGLEPIASLCQLLQRAPLLECLDVSNNPLLLREALYPLRKGVKGNITLKEFRFDKSDYSIIASDIQEEIAHHNNLFSSLSKEQPVLVGLLNAKRCNNLSEEVKDFLSQHIYVQEIRRSSPLHYFNYHRIGEMLESILLNRKVADQDSEAPISEEEVIAYIKSYYSSEKKQMVIPSSQKAIETVVLSIPLENTEIISFEAIGEKITPPFVSGKSPKGQCVSENNTQDKPQSHFSL